MALQTPQKNCLFLAPPLYCGQYLGLSKEARATPMNYITILRMGYLVDRSGQAAIVIIK